MVSMMMEKGNGPDEITYNVLISCLCRDGMVNEVIGLMRDMEIGGFRPAVITYNTVILGLCKAHRINTGINILEEMYILLIEGITSAGHRAEAMELARKLAARDFFPERNPRRVSEAIYSSELIPRAIQMLF